MTELKEAVFGKTDEEEQALGGDEITENIKETIKEIEEIDRYEQIRFFETQSQPVPEPIPQQPADDTLARGMEEIRRMKAQLAEENRRLEQRFAAIKRAETSVPAEKTNTSARKLPVGVLSAGVSLIFMGIALLVCLNSATGPYAAMKLAPIILVILGAEIIYNIIKRKTANIGLDITSAVVIASLLAFSALLSVVSVISSANGSERKYAMERISNLLAGELHDKITNQYVKSVDIEVNLYGENVEMYNTPADLTDGDMINLTVNFSDAAMPIREFARDCREIMDSVFTLRYNFGNITFIADDNINVYTLKIDCVYQADFSADRLAALVNYFGDNISDTDIPDIEEDAAA